MNCQNPLRAGLTGRTAPPWRTTLPRVGTHSGYPAAVGGHDSGRLLGMPGRRGYWAGVEVIFSTLASKTITTVRECPTVCRSSSQCNRESPDDAALRCDDPCSDSPKSSAPRPHARTGTHADANAVTSHGVSWTSILWHEGNARRCCQQQIDRFFYIGIRVTTGGIRTR